MSRCECPVCRSYSCRCSAYTLRQYKDAHQFDHSPDVRRRWAQDDANARVDQELRDRRRREEDEAEAERRRLAQERYERHERAQAAQQAQFEREQAEREQAEREVE